jgi:hypothetical protein
MEQSQQCKGRIIKHGAVTAVEQQQQQQQQQQRTFGNKIGASTVDRLYYTLLHPRRPKPINIYFSIMHTYN